MSANLCKFKHVVGQRVNSASSITVELVATVFKVPVRGQQCWISQQIGQNARIRCRQARLTAVYAARAVYAVTAV